MNQKLFSFINEGKIHLTPGNKILPAKELETLLNSEELREQVKKDAEQYRKDVVTEIEELKAKAQQDGYHEGFEKWAEHVAKLEEEIISVRKQYEKILVPVALKAVQKLLGREIEAKEETIIDILSTTLKAVSTHKKITIWVSPKEKGILEKNKDQLKKSFEQLESFQIRERADIEPGGSIIETEGGIINAQLTNQWQILQRAFEQLFSKKGVAS